MREEGSPNDSSHVATTDTISSHELFEMMVSMLTDMIIL